MNNAKKIGFMQGRLSNLVDGLIQAFPYENWIKEFSEANSIDINLMEWTLDFEGLYSNPIMSKKGRKLINSLSNKFNIQIPSLTGDCFMQEPFWKFGGSDSLKLKSIFLDVLKAASELDIKYIIVPLVDNGKIENSFQEENLKNFLLDNLDLLDESCLEILFESEYEPLRLKNFIKHFPKKYFGINYDIGNSASLGFEPEREFELYGMYIKNVHVKDREFMGSTVYLGEGDADFNLVFKNLKQLSYEGNFILQTARSRKNEHKKLLQDFRDFTLKLLNHYYV